MGLLARAQRRRDLARTELKEAVRLFPAESAAGRRAAEILEKMRRFDERQRGLPAPPGPDGAPTPSGEDPN